MEIEEVNVGGPLFAKLVADRDAVQREITQAEEGLKLLRFKLEYIETLLKSAQAHVDDEIRNTLENHEIVYVESGRFHGRTIAEVAVQVLSDEKRPLACMDIARRAMTQGFQADNIERARSHFSAVISKDMKNENPRFWQVDRGLIGLIEWRSPYTDAILRGTDVRKAIEKATNSKHGGTVKVPEI